MSSRLGRIVRRFVLFLLILALLLTGFLVYTVRRSFPQTNGTVHIRGLNKPVTVYRDRFGIPQIYASTTHDLFLAQGYLHAQDRFWQMDFWRHIGAGRLSEMFGKSQLRSDQFIRTMGWRRVAEQDIQQMDPTSIRIIQDYCDGVNAYLADHQGTALSLEYGILSILNRKYHIEPWTPADSMTWGVVMAWDLGGNMQDEIGRATLLNTLSPEQIADIYPPYPADHPVIVPSQSAPPSEQAKRILDPPLPGINAALDAAKRNTDLLTPILGARDSGIGSNNWVLSGKRTATGKPVLCNDPHLGIQMPSIWYEVGLHCATKSDDCRWDVTGFSFAGVPGVVIGHNNRIAWGFTNVGPDVQDLYVEKINPQNPNQYEVNGTWKDMRLVQETILVSDDKPVPLTVRYTRHGPIISDAYRALKEVHKSENLAFPEPYGISLRWTALEPGNTFPAIWRLNLARNWDEFREGASHFDLPSQNMVYADVDGNIGYQTPGKIPVRAGGDGRYPVPGWTDEFEWSGIIPFDELPYSLNPPQGYIASANNPVTDDHYPHFIASDWDYGFRAQRIVDMIQGAKDPLTLEQIETMQGDNGNLNAQTLVPILLQIPLQNGKLERTRELLKSWNQQDDMNSSGAALFEAFWKHLLEDTFHDDLPQDRWPSGGSRSFEIVRNLVQRPQDSWWDSHKTPAVEDRDQIMAQAFAEAIHELEQTLGNNPAHWRWGDLHTATFRNATFGMSGVAVLERIFNRGPFPTSGGNSIVNATSWYADESYEVADVPSMRMVVDFSNLSNSLAVMTTGQSGHAFHPNYIDMADLWRNIRYHPMLWDRAQIEHNAKGILTLTP
jgi:penicillin amidase